MAKVVKCKKTVEIVDGQAETRYEIHLPEYKQPVQIVSEEYVSQIIDQLKLLKNLKTK